MGKEIDEGEEVKELEEGVMLGWGSGETMVVRVFTGYDTKDYRSCQYIK